MEDIVQILLEIAFQFLFEVATDGLSRTVPPSGKTVLKILFYLLVGGLLGWISTLILPHSLISSDTGRVAYLVLAPVGIGLVMAQIGRSLAVRGKKRSSLETFGFGWLFAFTFALVRFIATRWNKKSKDGRTRRYRQPRWRRDFARRFPFSVVTGGVSELHRSARQAKPGLHPALPVRSTMNDTVRNALIDSLRVGGADLSDVQLSEAEFAFAREFGDRIQARSDVAQMLASVNSLYRNGDEATRTWVVCFLVPELQMDCLHRTNDIDTYRVYRSSALPQLDSSLQSVWRHWERQIPFNGWELLD